MSSRILEADRGMHIEINLHMTIIRKNVPLPVITTGRQNGFDYILLAMLLLYLFIFLATVQ